MIGKEVMTEYADDNALDEEDEYEFLKTSRRNDASTLRSSSIVDYAAEAKEEIPESDDVMKVVETDKTGDEYLTDNGSQRTQVDQI
jgi:hypothetical protein